MGSSHFDGDDVIVKGDDGTDDGKKISQVQDGSVSRLAVDTRLSGGIGQIPAENTIPICQNLLLNGNGSKEMDVNGSSTDQEFYWQPSSNVWYVKEMHILIQDPGSSDVGDFGSITGSLTNGLQIEIQSDGTLYELANLKDNGDLVLCFLGSTAFSGDEATGFLDSADTFFGDFVFPACVKIDSAQNDFVKWTVRDNLTDISFLRGAAIAFRGV